MRKIQILGLSILITCILFSCSVSEKVEGVYHGHWQSNPSSSITVTIITNGGDKVNIQAPDLNTNNVSVSSAGNAVTFSYNSSSAVNHGDVVSIEGSFINNHLTLSFEFVYGSLPSTQTATFIGEKQG